MDTLVVRSLALAGLLLLALAVGLWRRRRDGRPRPVPSGERLTAADLGSATGEGAERGEGAESGEGAELGARATLLQISTPVCAPCRAARRVLTAVAADFEGVRHVEIDAERHLDLVRRLDVLRTPTVLVLDAAGLVVARSAGVPTPGQVLAALLLAVPDLAAPDRRSAATAPPAIAARP